MENKDYDDDDDDDTPKNSNISLGQQGTPKQWYVLLLFTWHHVQEA